MLYCTEEHEVMRSYGVVFFILSPFIVDRCWGCRGGRKMQSGIGGLMAPEALINDVPQVCHTMYEKVESPGKDWLVTLCSYEWPNSK